MSKPRSDFEAFERVISARRKTRSRTAFFGLAIDRRGLDSHLFHQEANWNSAQIGQLKQCCGTIGIPALEFMRQLQQITLLFIAQGFLFPFLRQSRITANRRFGKSSVDSLDKLAFLGRKFGRPWLLPQQQCFLQERVELLGSQLPDRLQQFRGISSIVAILVALDAQLHPCRMIVSKMIAPIKLAGTYNLPMTGPAGPLFSVICPGEAPW